MYRTIISTSAAVAGLLIASLVDAQPPAAEQGGAAVESTEAQRFAALEKTLSGATLVGNFTVTGREKNEPTEERYELKSVRHVEGELWLFQARIRYGEHDVTVPLTLPIRWAGDTPVICLDNMGIPGMGVYTARVMIYADHYAGFWSGGDHGGHLFGIVEKNEKGEQTEKDESEAVPN
jgi:hypothetical protein